MWGVLPRRTQVLVVAAVAIALAWALEAAVEWVGGALTTPLKWVSLTTTLIRGGPEPPPSRVWVRTRATSSPSTKGLDT